MWRGCARKRIEPQANNTQRDLPEQQHWGLSRKFKWLPSPCQLPAFLMPQMTFRCCFQALASCRDVSANGTFECSCPRGFYGNGTTCSSNAWAGRVGLVAQQQSASDDSWVGQVRELYCDVLYATETERGDCANTAYSTAVFDIVQDQITLTVNALFANQAAANLGMERFSNDTQFLARATQALGQTVSVSEQMSVVEWNGIPTVVPPTVSPIAVDFTHVSYKPSCACWEVDFEFEADDSSFWVVYIPKAVGTAWSASGATYTSEEAGTFMESNFPCRNTGSLPPTTCCLTEMVDKYRAGGDLSDLVQTTAQFAQVCGESFWVPPSSSMLQGLGSPGEVLAGTLLNQTTLAVTMDGNTAQSRIRWDRWDLQSSSGRVSELGGRGLTMDTFVGIAKLVPQASGLMGTANRLMQLSLGSSQLFSTANVGEGELFLEYISAKVEEVELDPTGDNRRSTESVQWATIQFAIKDQLRQAGWKVKTDGTDMIPEALVRLGKGSSRLEARWTTPCVDLYTVPGTRDRYEKLLGQSWCAPSDVVMCNSPSTLPTGFFSFHVPLGSDYFESPSTPGSVFIEIQVELLDANNNRRVNVVSAQVPYRSALLLAHACSHSTMTQLSSPTAR